MNFTTERKDNKLILTTTVEGDSWKNAIKREEQRLAGVIKIPGFRPGKVPVEKVREVIDRGEVYRGALERISNDIVKEAASHEAVAADDVIDRAGIEIETVDADHAVIKAVYDLMPDVKIGEYKNILKGFKMPVPITDKQLDGELERLFPELTTLEQKSEQVVAEGDTTIIDYAGRYKDGEAFPGGTAKNYELRIGSGSFIPGFEDALVGMKAGDQKEINLKFPEEYHAAALKGKEVVFDVKLHEVKTTKKAPLTDELAGSKKIFNVKTAAELRERLRDYYDRMASAEALRDANAKLAEGIEKMVETTVPPSLIELERTKLGRQVEAEIGAQKLSMTKYLAESNLTREQYEKNLATVAERNVKISLGLQKIIENENITVTEAEIDEKFAELAKQYGKTVEEIKKLIPDSAMIEAELLNEKALKLLRESH